MNDLKNDIIDNLPGGDLPEDVKSIKTQSANESLDRKMEDISKEIENSFRKVMDDEEKNV